MNVLRKLDIVFQDGATFITMRVAHWVHTSREHVH